MLHKIRIGNCIQSFCVLAVLLFVFFYGKGHEQRQEQVWSAMEAGTAAVSVSNPRVNYIENPVGIDEKEIFFSWEPGVEQKAYEIVVRK
jgi:hypothetical protein